MVVEATGARCPQPRCRDGEQKLGAKCGISNRDSFKKRPCLTALGLRLASAAARNALQLNVWPGLRSILAIGNPSILFLSFINTAIS